MLRTKPPAVRSATGTPRAHAARPHLTKRHVRADTHEILHPDDLGLGQFFTLTGEPAMVGNLDTGRITLWNPAAECLFGWSAAEAIGRPLDMVIPPAIMRLYEVDIDLGSHSGNGHVAESRRPFEVPTQSRRGEGLRVEMSLARIEHPSRPGRYVLAMMRDVTERRRAEVQSYEASQFQSAHQQAKQTVRRHAQLAQERIDHLRRQIRRLRRSTERLGRTTDSQSNRLAKAVRVVEGRGERLEHDIEVLATTNAIESGELELNFAKVNLVPLVGRVVARARSRGTPHKLNVALPQGLTALVDQERIEQVIHSLLEYTFARCPRGCWIDVDLRRPLVGLARLEVRDYGRPVPPELRRRLMQGGDTDRELALVRALVDLHGGTLTLEFPADGGMRSVITLPTQRGRVA